VKVPYQDFNKKWRNQAWERLTVISHNGKILTQNYEIVANGSFTVTGQAGIRAQKYGGKLWEDEYRSNHYPQ
jgi:hypothetical protein